jgi:hypothetical protein
MLSQSFRVKVIVNGGYSGAVEIAIVKRWCTGNWSSDRVAVARLSPTAADFDDAMAQALSDAEQRVAVMRATARQARRIGRG